MRAEGRSGRPIFPTVAAAGIVTLLMAPPVRLCAETCALPAQHAGLVFPVERLDPEWACRILPLLDEYTTANKVGPIRAAIPESVYRYLLDRPPLAAALVNRLDIGLYKSEARGPNRYWGTDGEGTEGTIHLLFQDRTSRIYYVEGSHQSRYFKNLKGKAVVFLRMNPAEAAQEVGAVETTLVAYTKLDNRIVSGLLSLMRPWIGGLVMKKMAKGIDVVNRLAQEMRRHPDRVLFEAMDPPAFEEEDVAFLKAAVAGMGSVPESKRPAMP